MTFPNIDNKHGVPIHTSPSVIVIADEDAAMAEGLANVLHELGFRTKICTNGSEVLQRVREVRPVALLLEIGTAGINGWEILRCLRATPEGEHLPAVLTSGRWRVVDRFRMIGLTTRLAPTLVLPKPFTLLDLQHAFFQLGIRS
jgi:CheY-like chemotaxis protein